MFERLNRLSFFRAVLAASVAGAGSSPAGAGPEHAAHRQPLVVQVDYLVPEHRGGDKFRSPATIDTALAEDLAKRMQLPLETVAAESAGHGPRGTAGVADVQLTMLRDLAAAQPGVAVIPVDYRAAPMAIMRTDTTIRRWEDLAGRKVCVAQGGNHLGTLTGRYGAIEQVHPTPADAMIALRTGGCDALVHDSPMLEELLRFPEWKKFSARLRASQRSTLAFLVPAEDKETVALLRRTAFEWDAKGVPEVLVKNAVRNMAFEVYLEQEVPDCH